MRVQPCLPVGWTRTGWHGPWFRHLLRARGGGMERRWVRWRVVQQPWSGEDDAAELVIGPLAGHPHALILVVDCLTPTTSRVRVSGGGHQPWFPTCVRCRPVVLDRRAGALRQNRRSEGRSPAA